MLIEITHHQEAQLQPQEMATLIRERLKHPTAVLVSPEIPRYKMTPLATRYIVAALTCRRIILAVLLILQQINNQ